MTLITQKGCPACKYLIDEILPLEDVGVDQIHIETPEDSRIVSEEYPEVQYIPTLVMDCGGKKDYFVGVESIASIITPDDEEDIDEDEDTDVEV